MPQMRRSPRGQAFNRFSISPFQFLELHDARLVAYGRFAERYLHDDPNTAIFKLRHDDFAVQQCLQQNRAKLSKACQKVFASQ